MIYNVYDDNTYLHSNDIRLQTNLFRTFAILPYKVST